MIEGGFPFDKENGATLVGKDMAVPDAEIGGDSLNLRTTKDEVLNNAEAVEQMLLKSKKDLMDLRLALQKELEAKTLNKEDLANKIEQLQQVKAMISGILLQPANDVEINTNKETRKENLLKREQLLTEAISVDVSAEDLEKKIDALDKQINERISHLAPDNRVHTKSDEVDVRKFWFGEN